MDTSISVLAVDDSPTMRAIISNSLEKLGFEDVAMAEDGQSALDLLQHKPFGLIISDWEMTPMTGEQFLKELKQGEFCKIPVILLTGTSTRGTSFLAGASAYLPKPFNEADLRTAITSALRKF